jgi:4-hydroxybenzoyl-CoA reductase subunit beta
MMRLPKFIYRVARTIEDAVKMMADAGPEAMFVAGGTDLYPNMKRRQQTPKTVISVAGVAGLHDIRENGNGVIIGACMRLSEISGNKFLTQTQPAVARAAGLIATPLLRNMGTIGGNLLLDTRCNYYDQNYEWRRGINFCLKKDGDTCWVAPGSSKCWAVQSSDLAPVMVALGAKFKFVSIEGERFIEASELYNDDGIDYLNKRRNELLAEVHLPAPNGSRATYHKLRRRGSFDFPVLGVAAVVQITKSSIVEKARIVLGGVAPAPVEVTAAEAALEGHPFDEDRIAAAADACYLKARPLDNTDFVMGWRKQMARPFALRALRELRDDPRFTK